MTAEIRLALAAVEGNLGYKSLDSILPTLKVMDPNSTVWRDLTMGRAKLSYSISDGIGPHLHETTIQRARESTSFSLSLDSASTHRGGLTKDLDIHISYWDSIKSEAIESLLAITEMSSETAEILKNVVLTVLDQEGLKMKNLLAVSRDNPNVNKRLVKLLKEEANAKGSKLIDFGSCVLHTVHNAFEKGLNQLSVDIPSLAQCLHGFFKYSTIRREQFAIELMDLDLATSNFKRHVNSRWLSLKPAAELIDKQWPAITKYFLTTLPELAESGDKNAKDGIKTKYYQLICEQLRNSTCRLVLKEVIYVCEKFSPFLHQLQSSTPLAHRLFDYCGNLLHSVMVCLIKEPTLPDKVTSLKKVDPTKNLRDGPKMSPSAKGLYDKMSTHQQEGIRREFR